MAPTNDAPSSRSNPLALGADGLLDQRYRILRLLGEGGMGAVYYGEHVGLKRPVAVKVLHADLANREEASRRLQREAEVAATLHHPNIVEVFDVGVAKNGEPYLVMEYLEGQSLRDLMARHPRADLATACAVMEPVLLALQAAHRKDIVHRDLKPDNVFLARQPDGRVLVKVIDFGVSKIATVEPDRWRTQTGMVLGTPNYMSPEQARGAADVDHRTDLWAAGTILYEMLTGALPYAGDSFAEFFARLLTEPPRPPRSVYPELSPEVEPLLAKAICKEPAGRFQSAEEMLAALAQTSAFARRGERMSLLGASDLACTFAVGDLGIQAKAEADASLRPPPATPVAISSSRVEPAHDGPEDDELSAVLPRRRWPLLAAAGLGFVLVAVVVALIVKRSSTPALPTAVRTEATVSVPSVAVPAPSQPEPTRPTPSPPVADQPAGSVEQGGAERVPASATKPVRRKTAVAAEPAPTEPAQGKSTAWGGLGDSIRGLGSDLVNKARSQVKRIPDPRSK
jgi:serine/threonine protein kinase